jgi:hypothetical protein
MRRSPKVFPQSKDNPLLHLQLRPCKIGAVRNVTNEYCPQQLRTTPVTSANAARMPSGDGQ